MDQGIGRLCSSPTGSSYGRLRPSPICLCKITKSRCVKGGNCNVGSGKITGQRGMGIPGAALEAVHPTRYPRDGEGLGNAEDCA